MRESLATLTEECTKSDWILVVAKPETEPKPIPLVLFFFDLTKASACQK